MKEWKEPVLVDLGVEMTQETDEKGVFCSKCFGIGGHTDKCPSKPQQNKPVTLPDDYLIGPVQQS